MYLVSPLVPNGDVNDYLMERPKANRSHLIYGVAAGMEYLHRNGVAHGDLKCANVLVAEPEQALLTDFGFSYVTDNAGVNHSLLSSHHARGGTWVFEAPERVKDHNSRRDGASDVFAFGMLCFEMLTFPPLDDISIHDVHDKIVHHSKLPEQPRRYLSYGLTDKMWEVMKMCWSHTPSDRLPAKEIKKRLQSSVQRNTTVGVTRPGFQSPDAAVTRALGHLQALCKHMP
ncbi:hypothetical protein C0992_004913 [Termitomyces sp. T32_za158]|nr:hypothetical protein C0992_004913 [Termitomyces sp. T32_za158]